MRVAMCQVASGIDPRANLQLVREYTARAAAQGAELVVFPEATMSSFARPRIEVAESLDGPWATAVRELAARLNVVIVVGMFTPALDGSRVRNTLLVTGPDIESHYNKVHLFDALGYTESEQIEAGDEAVTFTFGGTIIGLTTCYDIRFPELYKYLARAGAAIILVPASWAPGPGKVEQWRSLVTARALDATSIVIGVGQARPMDPPDVGSRKPTGVGNSLAVGPTGEILATLADGPEVVVLDVDPAAVGKARELLPVLRNSRLWGP